MLRFLFVLLFAPLLATAGENSPLQKKLTAEDSILHHFLNEGAWKSPLFSRERERCIDSALVLLPHNAYLWQQRSMPLFKQGKYEYGMPYLDSAVKYDPGHWMEYRAFMKCIFQKSYRSALADFDAAQAINGNIGVMDHPYDFYRALCYLQLNDFQAAESLLRKVIAATTASHGDAWVHYLHWFYLGIVRHEQEDYVGAAQYLDKCLKEYSQFSDALYYRARCHLKLGDTATALVVAQKAQHAATEGRTFTEDNAFYEPYPYAIRKYYLDGFITALTATVKAPETVSKPK
jgi:tetratricopeptide (TPR) repeat protein